MLEKRFRTFNMMLIILPIIQVLFVLGMPFVSFDEGLIQAIIAYTLAGLFWLSFGVEIVLWFFTSQVRKQIENRGLKKSRKLRRAKIGLISFFKNREALINDIVFILSIIAVVLLIFFKYYSGWIFLISLVLLFLTFNYHCIFNGKNYRFLKALKNLKRSM